MRALERTFVLGPAALILAGAISVSSLGAAQAPQAGSSGPAASRALGSEDVARLQSVGEVAMRPDGLAIAYALNVPRELGVEADGPAWSRLHLVSFDGAADRPYVSGAVNVSHLRWTPGGGALGYLARRDGDEHRSIYVIPAQAGESLRLYQHVTDVEAFDWRADGRALAFVATEPVPVELATRREQGFNEEIYEEDWQARRLYVLELPQGPLGGPGTVRQIEVPGQPWSVVWSPDGRRLLTDLAPTPLTDDRYMYRRLYIIDAASAAVVARIENPGKLGAFAFSPDGRTVAFISGADIHDPSTGRLMIASADGGAPHDLMPGFEGDVDAFAFTANGRIVYLASVGLGSRVGRVRLDGRADAAVYDGVDPVFTALSLDARGDRMALAGESPARPTEVYVQRLDRRVAPARVTDHNAWLSDIGLARQEVVRWTAGDGLSLEGLLIHPLQRAAEQPVPLIVVAHGGPESHYRNGWLTGYSAPGQVAAGKGYAVFYPNYRGSTGRGVVFAKADQGDPLGAEFEDLLAGIDALVSRGLVDSSRVGMTGGSYGGYFTAWAATRYSERFAACVMSVGITNALSKMGTTDIYNEEELVHSLTNPYDNPGLYLERSPVMYAKGARTPLLILHGKEDTRVDPGQSRELYRALKVKGEAPVRLVLYPGEGHGNRRAAARYDYSLRMMQWFDHFLMEGRRDMPAWQVGGRAGGQSR
jgi:dipeptidyl aminopeptidase/acylaminoacyl peptidase